MPFKDLREFIARLEKEGQIQRIKEEVDWNLEAGAIIRWANEKGLPAPFFEKIKDYPDGYRIFGSPLGTQKRLAIAMDMDPNASVKEMQEEYLKRKQKPIKPALVKDAPCKENIYLGDKVDLLKLPVPFQHLCDGGRYLGTWHATINKDPDTGWANWGMYRHMLQNRNTLGIEAGPYTDFGKIHAQKYLARNKAMEVAISIGPEPISTFIAASCQPYGVSEVDIVGGIRGEPLKIVKCETVDLEVPATSEIVIEGEIRPGDEMEEGPFAEFTGYMVTLRCPRPVIRVKAITYRNSPILTMTCMGMPVIDDNVLNEVSLAADLKEVLLTRGLPVTGVSLFKEVCWTLAVVAVKVPYANVASDIAHVLWASRAGFALTYIIIVEDDVDPFNMGEVFHALATKCHPYKGIVRLEHATALSYEPWADHHERQYRIGARTYFDCTWPLDWGPADMPIKASFNNPKVYPPEVQEKALAKWHKYGY
ncbi:MAG: UbiD family decarboxylase [Chloroflexi bacterium]|nr:UbiD family decarboxylase [Chloroflexota bacterium]